MTDQERQQYAVLKLRELEIQIEKLKAAEAKSILQAGLQDDIKNRLDELQAMQVLSDAERSTIEFKVRAITSTKSTCVSEQRVAELGDAPGMTIED